MYLRDSYIFQTLLGVPYGELINERVQKLKWVYVGSMVHLIFLIVPYLFEKFGCTLKRWFPVLICEKMTVQR